MGFRLYGPTIPRGGRRVGIYLVKERPAAFLGEKEH